MPTYDYECENGHRFEAFQSMKDEPLTTCRECGGAAKRRIGTGAGFIFKGGGFYTTEYRSKEYKEKAKSESGAGGTSGSGTSAGGGETSSKPAESKPAAPKKPDAKSGDSKS